MEMWLPEKPITKQDLVDAKKEAEDQFTKHGLYYEKIADLTFARSRGEISGKRKIVIVPGMIGLPPAFTSLIVFLRKNFDVYALKYDDMHKDIVEETVPKLVTAMEEIGDADMLVNSLGGKIGIEAALKLQESNRVEIRKIFAHGPAGLGENLNQDNSKATQYFKEVVNSYKEDDFIPLYKTTVLTTLPAYKQKQMPLIFLYYFAELLKLVGDGSDNIDDIIRHLLEHTKKLNKLSTYLDEHYISEKGLQNLESQLIYLHGTLDTVVNARTAMKFVTLVPNSKAVIFEDMSHGGFTEQPQAIFKAIQSEYSGLLIDDTSKLERLSEDYSET